jgi:tetratricopeptide (TPR) repeat protein
VSVADVADAITELDVVRAAKLLKELDPAAPNHAFQRARLAIYMGDCDSAEAILQSQTESPDAVRLAELSRTCARATAGSLIVEDVPMGVWVRLQDSEDRALVPYIVHVVSEARATLKKDLGIELPSPLRIDLVRDLFSLASVSGLPVEAAETTGTVGIARWGRITMLTPRASRSGYPWEDTLAHEITHLVLTRGSRDFAPLWLQEGIAKREEDRWRAPRPFDGQPSADQVAKQALLDGTSVGIDQIGPSIAMLPTPQAAAISYAEVESFMDYWIAQHGTAAFTLLLLELKGLSTRDPDPVMLSITGFPLRYWIARWQEHLRGLPEPENSDRASREREAGSVVQSVRLGDLLAAGGKLEQAAEYFDKAVEQAPDKPAVRFRAGAARLALGDVSGAGPRLGGLPDVASLHGGWLGVLGRQQRGAGTGVGPDPARHLLDLAIAIDPLSVEAACEGHAGRTSRTGLPEAEPIDQDRKRLCVAARKIVRD